MLCVNVCYVYMCVYVLGTVGQIDDHSQLCSYAYCCGCSYAYHARYHVIIYAHTQRLHACRYVINSIYADKFFISPWDTGAYARR